MRGIVSTLMALLKKWVSLLCRNLRQSEDIKQWFFFQWKCPLKPGKWILGFYCRFPRFRCFRFRASDSASTKNVVISLVAIPPTSAEAPDPADRFRFRFPGPYSLNDQLSYLSNGYVLEKCPGNGVNIKHDALFDPHPLKIGFLGQFGPFPSPTAAGGGPQWPFLNSYSYFACLRPGIKHDYVP